MISFLFSSLAFRFVVRKQGPSVLGSRSRRLRFFDGVVSVVSYDATVVGAIAVQHKRSQVHKYTSLKISVNDVQVRDEKSREVAASTLHTLPAAYMYLGNLIWAV
jgi:hypothetical protein